MQNPLKTLTKTHMLMIAALVTVAAILILPWDMALLLAVAVIASMAGWGLRGWAHKHKPPSG